MIALVAVLTVKDGSQSSFETAAAALAAAVRANEPGCKLYTFSKSRTDPCSYTALELYETQDDVAAHGTTEHMKALGPALGACFAARPVITMYDVVV